MLNEEKVILMTKMAIYEKRDGRHDFKLSKYYRTDYVGLNIINTAIVATLLYIMIIALLALINIDSLMTDIVTMDLLALAQKILLWYLIFIAIYMVMAYIVYSLRYRQSKKKLKTYDDNLRRLYRICREEQKYNNSMAGGNSENVNN